MSRATPQCPLGFQETFTIRQRLGDLGVSAADFIKESLGLLHTNIEATKETAWSEGYNQAATGSVAQDSSPLFQTDKTAQTRLSGFCLAKLGLGWTELDCFD